VRTGFAIYSVATMMLRELCMNGTLTGQENQKKNGEYFHKR
jgi:hypothetical protein